MGCVSSKLFKDDFKEDDDDYPNHVVSLTSSTYGVLNLEKHHQQPPPPLPLDAVKDWVIDSKKASPPRNEPPEPEEINAWEMMQGLEEEAPKLPATDKKSPKPRVYLYGFGEIDARSPLKFLNQMASPKKSRRFAGKENSARSECSPKTVTKVINFQGSSKKASPLSRIPRKESPCDGLKRADSNSGTFFTKRKSLGPLFDPEMVESFEKELSAEKEQIKKMVAPVSRNSQNDSSSILQHFEQKCPPGGQDGVVLYTTTLRGIRKTFEDCNKARSVIESHQVQIFERDISMHSGFKNELKSLVGPKGFKVPLVFVKGRLIGGAEEVVKLEEDGKLAALLGGISAAAAVCNGCGGFRFVMCRGCNGSCKVVDGCGRTTKKCGECNENGLIQCPFCS